MRDPQQVLLALRINAQIHGKVEHLGRKAADNHGPFQLTAYEPQKFFL